MTYSERQREFTFAKNGRGGEGKTEGRVWVEIEGKRREGQTCSLRFCGA